ncbi:ribosomal protein S23 like protein [Microtus ochrogaster]|uniref:Ribosomal protein S23 like protein n=1 Tax=Microtus ochrogaster TaxID=79684 RepID=A0A8J6GD93_MICOH|nr:ribosomal protein S23 like protein [Microtus ochrogaster]
MEVPYTDNFESSDKDLEDCSKLLRVPQASRQRGQPGGQKGHIGYFNNLKVDSKNITYSMTLSTKSSNQNFIVFLNEVQATIIGDESCDLLAVLDELHPDTLTDSRIWLLGFNSYFFQHDSLGMRGTSKRIGLQGCAQVGFLVLFVQPLLVPRWLRSFLAVRRPRHLPILPTPRAREKEQEDNFSGSQFLPQSTGMVKRVLNLQGHYEDWRS